MVKNKISLWVAILINLNVIVGGAFFLGAQGILKQSGKLAPITWIVFGLTVLPIVMVLAKLSKIYPHAGGIYIYSKKEINPFWGFISGWGYFIGTIAGNAILIHKFGQGFLDLGFNSIFQKIGLTGFSLDVLLITLFTLLNLLNINFLEKTQKGFAFLKMIPLLIIIIGAFFLFKFQNISATPINFSGFFNTIPFVLFAYMGLEVCCSITHQIDNGQKNASRAILISFVFIMGIYAILQLCMLGIYGINTTNPFLEILPQLTNNPFLIGWGNKIIEFAIISSFLGGFYGMFYANNWVLYAMAQEKTLPYSNHLTNLNKFKIPWVTVILQGLITILFLIITKNTYYLITMSNIGVLITYLLSAISIIAIFIKQKVFKNLLWGVLGAASSIFLLYYCFKELVESGFKYLVPFLIILGIGIVLNKFTIKRLKKEFK